MTAERARDVDAVGTRDAALTLSSARGFSLNTSRPPAASSPSSGSREVNRYRRVLWNALHTIVGSFSAVCFVSLPLPLARLSFCGTPWNIASLMNRSVFSTLPMIRAHRLVTRLTTFTPSNVEYSKKCPDWSNTAFGNPISKSGLLPISRSTASLLPKSISSSLYASAPARWTSLADSSVSSMTHRNLPVAKRNTRTLLSGPMVENCSPSWLTSRDSALVFALAMWYRSVSSLNLKSTSSGVGASYVAGDQYSITPLSSELMTHLLAALYLMHLTAALCSSSVCTGVWSPLAPSYTCIAPSGAPTAIFCCASPFLYTNSHAVGTNCVRIMRVMSKLTTS